MHRFVCGLPHIGQLENLKRAGRGTCAPLAGTTASAVGDAGALAGWSVGADDIGIGGVVEAVWTTDSILAKACGHALEICGLGEFTRCVVDLSFALSF